MENIRGRIEMEEMMERLKRRLRMSLVGLSQQEWPSKRRWHNMVQAGMSPLNFCFGRWIGWR